MRAHKIELHFLCDIFNGPFFYFDVVGRIYFLDLAFVRDLLIFSKSWFIFAGSAAERVEMILICALNFKLN